MIRSGKRRELWLFAVTKACPQQKEIKFRKNPDSARVLVKKQVAGAFWRSLGALFVASERCRQHFRLFFWISFFLLHKNLTACSSQELQNKIKRDPDSYTNEFIQQEFKPSLMWSIFFSFQTSDILSLLCSIVTSRVPWKLCA